jgi:phage terminase large subunit
MVMHRRAGKTVACVADLVLSALVTPKQDGRYAYIAPQFNQAKDVAWLYVKRLTADIPGVTYNESELRANLPNGAHVRLYGADNPDRLRGLFLDGVIMDEYADMRPRVWGEVVRPMLSDRKGWAAFIGTPKGHNEFYRVWQDAKHDSDWFKMILRGSESGLVSDGELAAMRKTMTDDQYEQEVECSFEAAIAGAYYGRDMNVALVEGRITSVPYDPELPVYTAWDLGYRDDTAIWWYQVVRGEVHVIDFHASSGQPISYYGDVIGSRPYKYGRHWLPHDARAKTLASGGKSTVEQLASFIKFETMAIVPDLSIQDGIQAVRMMLPRTWFDETACDLGLEALRQYQREYDEDKKAFKEKPRHDWTSHAADAFRMLAIAWREEVKQVKKDEPIRGIAIGNPHRVTMNELWKTVPKRSERI